MVKELGCYGLATLLVLVCYVIGNVVVSGVWGVSSAYSTWLGVFRAVLETAAGLVAYFLLVGTIPFLSNRHIGVPPLVIAMLGLGVSGLSYYTSLSSGDLPPSTTTETLAFLVNMVGWGGIGAYALSQREQLR